MDNKRTYFFIFIIFLLFAIALVCWIYFFSGVGPSDKHWAYNLNHLNAILNCLSLSFVLLGVFFIKRKKKVHHIICMLFAGFVSACFLLSYLTYHYYLGDIKFIATGPLRSIYFVILITHILGSILLLPSALLTYALAILRNFQLHIRVVKYVVPLWIFVSTSGLVVYYFVNFLNH